MWEKFVVVPGKQPRRVCSTPQVLLKSFPNIVGRLLGTKEVGKHHGVEKSRDSLFIKLVSLSLSLRKDLGV